MNGNHNSPYLISHESLGIL